MYFEYTVVKIFGDYAILRADNGVENQVALAFLPPEICDGDRVACENFVYRILK